MASIPNTVGSVAKKESRLLAVLFAWVSGGLSLAFLWHACQFSSALFHDQDLTHSLRQLTYIGFAWALLFAIGLLIWGIQRLTSREWIDQSTLQMIAVVSGATLSIVTFILFFVSEIID